MNIVVIFLFIVIILVVVGILIHQSGKFDAPSKLDFQSGQQAQNFSEQTSNLPTNSFFPNPLWSQPEPYNPEYTGQCLAYTFLAGVFTPAIPSYSALNTGGGRDIVVENNRNYGGATGYVQQTCIDPDQLFAYTAAHKCQSEKSTSAGTGCITTVQTEFNGQTYAPGSFVPPGAVEGDPSQNSNSQLWYAPCIPSTLDNNLNNSVYCLGSIGLLIPNFEPQPQYDLNPQQNNCLQGVINNATFTADGYYQTEIKNCDLSVQNQIFRMVRYDLDSNFNLVQNDTGRLAAIIHRVTGFYLSPKLQTVTDIQIQIGNTGANIVNSQYYAYDYPVINFGSISDNFGNSWYQSIDLVLVNPINDTYRNGVYWLLQNQVLNPQLNPQLTNIKNYAGIGVYPNQTNYLTQFPAGLDVPSYFITQALKTGTGLVGASGIADVNGKLNFSDVCTQTNNSGPYNCWFSVSTDASFGTSTVTPGQVSSVDIDIAPQQIVYVPDPLLLPPLNVDSTGLWNYLSNNFSINIDSNNNPVLTPYRQTSKTNVIFSMVGDNNGGYPCPNWSGPGGGTSPSEYCSNVFFTLSGVIPNPNNSDTQFIDYTQFPAQIQTGVSSLITTDFELPGNYNANYKKKSNPFNTQT